MEPQRHLLWGPQGQQEWKRPVQKTSESWGPNPGPCAC
ncbi:rCG58194, isoform CRA_a [Rattus norvegicus]|uniref:RCG58194, isoform CRA_a n=1 Tax=Rattus norvegicus TaxID=10116 RepID=A6J4Y2_RAT|nr:rCG58194, isoform CRA_a [Rattus norvegicus]